MVPLAVFLLALPRLPHYRAAPDNTEGDPRQFSGKLEQTPEKKAKHHIWYAFRLFGVLQLFAS